MNGHAARTGRVTRVAGPVVGGAGLENVRLYDVVLVGETGLVGEVIRLSKDICHHPGVRGYLRHPGWRAD